MRCSVSSAVVLEFDVLTLNAVRSCPIADRPHPCVSWFILPNLLRAMADTTSDWQFARQQVGERLGRKIRDRRLADRRRVLQVVTDRPSRRTALRAPAGDRKRRYRLAVATSIHRRRVEERQVERHPPP
jgi:hypothetical protein